MEEKVVALTDDNIQEEIKNVQENLKEKLTEAQIVELLKSNLFTLDYKDKTYRLRKPNYGEITEMYEKTADKKTSLILDGNCLTATELKKKWEIKGVDISAKEKEIVLLKKDKDKIQIELGELLEKSEESNVENLKGKIEDINQKIKTIQNEINIYLDSSLENRIGVFQYSYLAYLITEKKSEEIWVKAFDKYEDYLLADSIFVNKLNMYAVIICHDELETI